MDPLAAFADELAREGFSTVEEEPPSFGDRVLVFEREGRAVRLSRVGGVWRGEMLVDGAWVCVDRLRAVLQGGPGPSPDRGFAGLVDDTRELLERLRE
jgi:hypothetical protein